MLFLVVFIQFVLYLKYTTAAASLEVESSFNSNLINAAESVINTSFLSETSTINFIISLNNETKRERAILINDLVARCDGVVFIEDVESIQPRHRLYNVLFVDDFMSFQKLLSKISADTFVIDGFYLMIFVEELEPRLSEITKLLWNIFLFNIDFLAFSIGTEDEEVNLWTFIPFTSCESGTCHDRKCGDTTPKVINKFISGSFQSNIVSFPEKISNLHQCPVKIVTFNAPPMMMICYPHEDKKIFRLNGVDGQMMELLSQQLNFSIDLFHISDNIR